MTIIKEFRIPMPFTLDEYQRGQLYSVARASVEATIEMQSSNEGVEVLEYKEFTDNEMGTGIYTKTIYHVSKQIPEWAAKILPSSLLKLYEESWNAFPKCKTIVTCPFLNNFSLLVESIHKEDCGDDENALGVSEEILKKREVAYIDIFRDQVTPSLEKEDPLKVKPTKMNGRGNMEDLEWKKNMKPMMCCYKLVTVEAKLWPWTPKLETKIQEFELNLFTRFHKQIFCWFDDWLNLSLEDIHKYEERIKQTLQETFAEAKKKKKSKKSKKEKKDKKEKKEKKSKKDKSKKSDETQNSENKPEGTNNNEEAVKENGENNNPENDPTKDNEEDDDDDNDDEEDNEEESSESASSSASTPSSASIPSTPASASTPSTPSTSNSISSQPSTPNQLPPNAIPLNPNQLPPNAIPLNPNQLPPNVKLIPMNPNQLPPNAILLNPNQLPPNVKLIPMNPNQIPPNARPISPNQQQNVTDSLSKMNPNQIPPNARPISPNQQQNVTDSLSKMNINENKQ